MEKEGNEFDSFLSKLKGETKKHFEVLLEQLGEAHAHIETLDDSIIEMQGHSRDYADEIAELSHSFDEEHALRVSIEETWYWYC